MILIALNRAFWILVIAAALGGVMWLNAMDREAEQAAVEAYAPEVFTWLRQQLASGAMEYRELLNARRSAGLEHPYDVADLIRAHVRFLVMAGEAIEHKRYLGDSDPRSPRYHGWHPVFELAGGDA